MGYICPPASGDYTFWVASNDHSELWLSTDDDPANKMKIAYVAGATNPRQWNKFPSQRSSPVWLEQGKTYYIEALHKQGVGMDHISVGWRLPDGTLERPIPGSRLSPFVWQPMDMMASSESLMLDDVNALGEANAESELQIFPNPARSGVPDLMITGYEGKYDVQGSVQIQRLTGEVVYARPFNCEGDCGDYAVQVGKALDPGVYVVNVITNGKLTSKRLLVK